MQFTSVNPSTPMIMLELTRLLIMLELTRLLIMLELTRLLIMRNDEKQVCLLVDNVIDA